MTDWAVRATGLGKRYRLYPRPIDRVRELVSPTRAQYHREVWALRDLNLSLERGSVTGLVGVNGAGKSTFLKLVAGKLRPTTGKIESRGRISSILELGTGFQPHLTGRQNALVNALFLNRRPWEAEERLAEVLAFADLGQYADHPISTYSSGMQARLAFAVLTTLDPEILILDEALATGDTGFAAKCKAFLRNLCRSGCTTIVTSHDYSFVAEVCDRVGWIDKGKLQEFGEPARVVQSYLAHLSTAADLVPRPRHALLKIEAEDPSHGHAFITHVFEWLGPDGEVVGEHYVGDDRIFLDCLTAAGQIGLSPSVARAGWGLSQDLSSRKSGPCRACRPDLGTDGAAYLALDVPPLPRPLPRSLRVAIYQDEQPTSAILSLFVNGRWRELGRVRRDIGDPWRRVSFDVSSYFAETPIVPVPAFDPTRVAGPAGSISAVVGGPE